MHSTQKRPVVVYIVTSMMSHRLLAGQLRYLSGRGFHPVLIAGKAESDKRDPARRLASALDAPADLYETISVPMVREIAPFKDVMSLV